MKDKCKLVDSKTIDINEIENLFQQGANPNALEDLNPDKDFNDCTYWATFFSECIFSSQEKNPDLYPVLELFIKYGLDVDKYGSSILSDFHFINNGSDTYRMCKLLLDNMSNCIDVSTALSSIGTEESYLNCSFNDMDFESNELFGLYTMIESFSKNNSYNHFYKLPKKINEKFVKLNVSGDFITLDKNKITVKSEKNRMCMISKIEMQENSLIVEDNYGVYINNKDEHKFVDNIFTKYANEYLKNETIISVEFKHYQFTVAPKTFIQGRTAIINLTNDKKIVYEEDTDNKLEIIKIV